LHPDLPATSAAVVVEPPHRVVVTWGTAGSDLLPPGASTVEILLHPDGDGTLLELVHRDLPADEIPKHDIGWGHFLARVALVASGLDPGPDAWAEA
jgi:uncharacterized protein YndB with AHSA1/START domain